MFKMGWKFMIYTGDEKNYHDGYACTVQYAKWMLKSYSVSNWRVIKNESNVDHEVDVVYKSKCVLNDLLRFIWQMVQLTRPSCKWIY